MLIGEVAKLSGVTKNTVRFYTQKRLIGCTLKEAGRRHYADYAPAVVELIQGIRTMQAIGFTLSEIQPLAELYISGNLTSEQSRRILRAKLSQIERKQRQLHDLAAVIKHKLANPHLKNDEG